MVTKREIADQYSVEVLNQRRSTGPVVVLLHGYAENAHGITDSIDFVLIFLEKYPRHFGQKKHVLIKRILM